MKMSANTLTSQVTDNTREKMTCQKDGIDEPMISEQHYRELDEPHEKKLKKTHTKKSSKHTLFLDLVTNAETKMKKTRPNGACVT